ncbi:MAG: hypothetical protein ACRDD1_06820, partial [Planctomycetia bacterium]
MSTGHGIDGMELHEALARISEIRDQVARGAVFRGYRAFPVAFSGVVAFAAAMIQAVWIPSPTEHLSEYLLLWSAAAAIGLFAAGIE